MSEPASLPLDFLFCRKPSEVPDFVWACLYQHEVNANTILPILEKCWTQEKRGVIPQDHLWIVAFVQTPVYTVKLILACTNSITGKYPLFVFTPGPLKNDAYLYPSLTSAARHLKSLVPPQRIYSVFGRDLLSRTFADIWTKQTNIPLIADPYYCCKISYLTRATLELRRRKQDPILTAEVRPAVQRDWDAVARLCKEFAATSEPFTLTDAGARAEAGELIANKLVWVLTLGSQHVVSLVAFTRNSKKVATITKVFTDPDQRRGGYAERLVRAVCDYLLYECAKEKVALFVGLDNRADIVYQRVGFVGIGVDAEPVDGIDTWSEIGFDRSHVTLGHW